MSDTVTNTDAPTNGLGAPAAVNDDKLVELEKRVAWLEAVCQKPEPPKNDTK